jgi:hypothetical protein
MLPSFLKGVDKKGVEAGSGRSGIIAKRRLVVWNIMTHALVWTHQKYVFIFILWNLRAPCIHIEGVKRLTCSHEQPVVFCSTETKICTDLR